MAWRVDTNLWNLAVPASLLPASLLVTGCSERLIEDDTGFIGSGTTTGGTTTVGSSVGPSVTTNNPVTVTTVGTTVGPGQCIDSNDCPPGYTCRYNVCYYDYGCDDGCCSGGCYYEYCYLQEDCGYGQACIYDYCEYVGTLFDCAEPDDIGSIAAIPSDLTNPVSLAFTERAPGATQDLVVVTADLQFGIFRAPLGDSPPTIFGTGSLDVYDIAALEHSDDGIDDVILAGDIIRLFEGSGNGGQSAVQEWNIELLSIVGGEFDGSPGEDALGVDPDGVLQLLSITTDGIQGESNLGPVANVEVGVGSFFGSGLDDVAVHLGGPTIVYAGGANFGQDFLGAPEYSGTANRIPVLMDFDGDGDDDLVGMTPSSNSLLAFWRNNGGSFEFTPQYQRLPGSFNVAQRIDLDGDGVDELAVGGFGDYGFVRFAGNFPYSVCLGGFANAAAITAMDTGDIDGDGDDDLAFISAGELFFVVN